MKSYTLKLTLVSDTLIGSGEGYGAVIDTDVVFDSYGFPYIPAKRIKGCLRESADEVESIFKKAKIGKSLNVDEVFGKQGDTDGKVYFSNLYIQDYQKCIEWMEYIKAQDFGKHIHTETVLSNYTFIRRQTRLEKGVAKEHSLRSSRVLNTGLEFYGELNLEEDTLETLALAIQNLRSMGTMRNRGLGHVSCQLFDKDKDVGEKIIKELKTL